MRPGGAALSAVRRLAPSLAPASKRVAWRLFYDLASRGDRGRETAFMNYGYAGPGDEVAHDPDQFGRQLYARVAAAGDLAGKAVLDVGCGRGGGTAFVFDRFRPRMLTGLDLAPSAIARCRAEHARPGLSFVAGDAEALPFPDGSFDAVLSIESSHCYPDVTRFLCEVARVLRPGGLLLLADFRHTALPPEARDAFLLQEDVARLHEQIATAGFRTVEEEDVTDDVVRALRLDSANRRSRLERGVPRPLRRHVVALAAVEGSAMFRAYEQRRWTYLRLVLERA